MPGPDINVYVSPVTGYAMPVGAGNSQEHGVVSGASLALPVLTAGPAPSVGATLQPTDPVALTFAAQGADDLDRVILWARFPGLANSAELIYDTDSFVPLYAISSRAGGVFTIRRVGGWPSAPSIFAHADTTKGGKN